MRNQRGDTLSIEVVDHVPVEFVMEELLGSIGVGRLRDRRREMESLIDKAVVS
ncbi:MAG: hypothetical protein QXO47_03190 [Thermoproteota archaeon]